MEQTYSPPALARAENSEDWKSAVMMPSAPTRITDLARASCNFDAFTAAEEVLAGTIGRLLVVGTEGTGKTHLLHATRRAFAEAFHDREVRVYRAEEWLLQRQSVSSVRILLVDDAHEVLGVYGAAVALAEAVEEVLSRNGQVVLCSVQAPSARARAHFRIGGEGWHRVDLRRPNVADRVLLLAQMAAQAGLNLDPVAERLIAERVSGALRGLRGALNRLLALREQSRDIPLNPARVVGLLNPLETSGAFADLSEATWAVVNKRFGARHPDGRDYCAYLLCGHAGVTEAAAADWLRWGRSAVHHAVQRMSSTDADLRQQLALAAVELDRELLRQPDTQADSADVPFDFSAGQLTKPAS